MQQGRVMSPSLKGPSLHKEMQGARAIVAETLNPLSFFDTLQIRSF